MVATPGPGGCLPVRGVAQHTEGVNPAPEASAIRVRRSGPLEGTVRVSGAKNSALKLMAAALLAPGRSVLHNVPRIADVTWMGELLERMGCTVDHEGSTVTVDVPDDVVPEAPYDLVERMRASIVVLGPLEELGAEFTTSHGYIEARAEQLTGARVLLEFPSVGATENLLMASVLAKGTTVIDNAAREPEIADLASFLNRMGAVVTGAGSSTIIVEGVEQMAPVEHTVVADRIEAATYLAAVGIAGGEVTIEGARAEHMDMLVAKLGEMGMRVSPTAEGVRAVAPGRLRPVDVSTLPYPGVATDYQPFVVAMLCVADGVGIVTENIFGGRFRTIDELARLGADIRAEGHHVVIRGVEALSGAPVRAPDIRAGAALVVAGLAAEGETLVGDAHHVARGYEDLVGRLASLGADIAHA